MARLGGDLALALDPVVLARRLGIAPDSWQADLLRSDAHQRILLCCRQAGKSTVAALLALHAALYRPPALVLLLSPSLRQSQELYRKVRSGYRALGEAAPGVVEETALRLELANGSRVVSLPGKEATVRGFSGATLLVVDEASRVPDELYFGVRPMLAVSGGSLVLLSTPFGQRGFFWHAWSEGGDDWLRVKITAEQCPRIDPAWLAKEREAIGDWWYRQEYGCEFVDAADQVFAQVDVLRALSDEVRPLFERMAS
jgi:hypothetical protein